MKKLVCVLMLVTAFICCGCTGADVDEPAGHGNFSETAEVHITMEGVPGDEYADAAVESVWTDGVLDSEPVSIKLRGNSTKESEKKAYTIKFEEPVAFMGMDAGKKWALVSNPYDKSLLRPALGFYYADALDLDYVSQTRLCKVWLNGEYMGVYTAVEPVEAGDGRVEINPDNGDFMLERNFGRVEEDVVYIVSPGGMRFEFNEPEEPDEAQQAQCYQMLADAEEAIFSEDHTVYEKYIDVDSFVDFYIFHEMVKDVDFGQYSTRYYFKDGVMYAGPVWDLDLSMGNVSGEKNEEKYDLYNNLVEEEVFDPDYGDSSSGLWVSAADYYYWLCRDPWFMSRVQQRWQAVRPVTENLTTANELGESVIDMYMEAHGEALESNFMEGAEDPCWMVNVPSHVSEWHQPEDTYEGNVEMLRQWLVKRAAYLDTQFGQYIYEPEKAVN